MDPPVFSRIVGWIMAVTALLIPVSFFRSPLRRLPDSPWTRDDKLSQVLRNAAPHFIWWWDPLWPQLPLVYKVLVVLQYPVLSAAGVGLALGIPRLIVGAYVAFAILWIALVLIRQRAVRALAD